MVTGLTLQLHQGMEQSTYVHQTLNCQTDKTPQTPSA